MHVYVCVFCANAGLFIVCQISAPSLVIKRGRLVPTALPAKSCCPVSVFSCTEVTKQVRLFYMLPKRAAIVFEDKYNQAANICCWHLKCCVSRHFGKQTSNSLTIIGQNSTFISLDDQNSNCPILTPQCQN